MRTLTFEFDPESSDFKPTDPAFFRVKDEMDDETEGVKARSYDLRASGVNATSNVLREWLSNQALDNDPDALIDRLRRCVTALLTDIRGDIPEDDSIFGLTDTLIPQRLFAKCQATSGRVLVHLNLVDPNSSKHIQLIVASEPDVAMQEEDNLDTRAAKLGAILGEKFVRDVSPSSLVSRFAAPLGSLSGLIIRYYAHEVAYIRPNSYGFRQQFTHDSSSYDKLGRPCDIFHAQTEKAFLPSVQQELQKRPGLQTFFNKGLQELFAEHTERGWRAISKEFNEPSRYLLTIRIDGEPVIVEVECDDFAYRKGRNTGDASLWRLHRFDSFGVEATTATIEQPSSCDQPFFTHVNFGLVLNARRCIDEQRSVEIPYRFLQSLGTCTPYYPCSDTWRGIQSESLRPPQD